MSLSIVTHDMLSAPKKKPPSWPLGVSEKIEPCSEKLCFVKDCISLPCSSGQHAVKLLTGMTARRCWALLSNAATAAQLLSMHMLLA